MQQKKVQLQQGPYCSKVSDEMYMIGQGQGHLIVHVHFAMNFDPKMGSTQAAL